MFNKWKDKAVLTGINALVHNGISTSFETNLEILTDDVNLKGATGYCYVEELDLINYLQENPIVDQVYVPTAERALIELIKHNLRYIDEGFFLEGMDMYVTSDKFNYNLLIEVANHFKVSKGAVDYWIKESEDYEL